MKQTSYETILECIKYGSPATADKLITEFNQMMSLANEKISDMQREAKLKEEEAKMKPIEKMKPEVK